MLYRKHYILRLVEPLSHPVFFPFILVVVQTSQKFKAELILNFQSLAERIFSLWTMQNVLS